jgi:signal peptidase II
MNWNANRRIAAVAAAVFVLDQLTKGVVQLVISTEQDKVLLDGFFKFVNWGNTGAAWSLFKENNILLAIVSIVALFGLIYWRNQFDTRTIPGQMALGLIIGGILGNLLDRLVRGQVVDFLRFYMYQRDGREIGFPAFNVADSAICVGVALLIITSWSADNRAAA